MALEFSILGPLEVARDGRPVALGGRRERMLLAILLVHRDEVVSTDRIFDELYGERPPATAAASLQNAVSKLRKTLGADVIQTRAPGYALAVSAGALDSARFERLVAHAPVESEPRAKVLREALALWRGPPLSDFGFEPFAQAEIARLDELRLMTLEERIDANLSSREPAPLVSELRSLIAKHPFRERLRRQLMLALYADGRQADALEAYQEARQMFLGELGVEPSPLLRDLQRAILEQQAELPTVGRTVLPAARTVTPEVTEQRQMVTVLFADVVHSTRLARALDLEASHELMARYFAVVRRVIERHGGTAETFIGDAVMAVFGVPRVHEDDALRAVRAALAVLHALETLNRDLAKRWGVEIAVRIGVNTGEVVAGGPGPLLATGETVNFAKRLEELAGASEILVGELTWRLVRDAVESEAVELGRDVMDVEGARRILAITDAQPFARRLETPIVGRDHELERLRQALEHAVADERAHLVTVLGPAGIGKTRLALAFAAAAADQARVVTGHCPSFGDALTYWPLREIVEQAGETAAEVAELLDHGRAEEILPATKALFESLARDRPLVVMLEDLHWAEPTFLELVDHLADRIRAAPVLLLCLARLELLEERDTWGGGLTSASSLLLGPLSVAESEALVGALVGMSGLDDLARERVVETAEGNPLFVEQLLSAIVLGETEEVPPTIEALLAARLARLGPGERTVIEAAAVAGREFSAAAVGDLVPEAAAGSVDRHLASVVRRELLRPLRSPLLGEEAFAFRHILIRDAAYRATPKVRRGTLHRSFARRLSERMQGSDEVVGYHLEQAYRLQTELGHIDEPGRLLAAEAGDRLARAGIRAWKRGDVSAAVNLLDRATSLLPGGERQRELLCELGLAFRAGGQFERAGEVLHRALDASIDAKDRRLEHRARIELVAHRLTTASATRAEELLRATSEAIPEFEVAADDRSLGRAWLLGGHAEGALLCRNERWRDAAERALHHYERAGWNATTAISAIAAALYHGPTPVPEAVERCLSLAGRPDSLAKASVFTVLAALRALEGRFDEARSLVEASEHTYAELGHRADILTSVGWARGEVELASGDVQHAGEVLAELCERLEAMHAAASLATQSAVLAEALYLQERWDEALDRTLVSERRAAVDDLSAQCLSRGVRAKVLARRGELDGAKTLAVAGVAIADQTDSLNLHAKVLMDLSEVLCLAECPSEAVEATRAALTLYERKGNVVGAAHARDRLGELAST